MPDRSLRYLVMAKSPRPGAVKTRLAAPPDGIGSHAAAGIAEAFLQATAARLARRGPVTLAVAPDEDAAALRCRVEAAGTPIAEAFGQGSGSLGSRIAHAWARMGAGPVALFGIDAPDLPDAALDAIPDALDGADAAIGASEDGGYWTLAAASLPRPMLDAIDWGSDRVYDQSLRRAQRAGLRVADLPRWSDVDLPEDLAALRRRLESASGRDADLLERLRATIDRLLTPDPADPGAVRWTPEPP